MVKQKISQGINFIFFQKKICHSGGRKIIFRALQPCYEPFFAYLGIYSEKIWAKVFILFVSRKKMTTGTIFFVQQLISCCIGGRFLNAGPFESMTSAATCLYQLAGQQVIMSIRQSGGKTVPFMTCRAAKFLKRMRIDIRMWVKRGLLRCIGVIHTDMA